MLGAPDAQHGGAQHALNLAVRAAFPLLEADWVGATATYCDRCMSGRPVVTRAGTRTRAHLGLFAGTIFMGDEPRGFNALPLPAFHVNGVEVCCYVDGAAASRAARCPSAAEAVLYLYVCVDADATLVGERWLGGPPPGARGF